MKAKALHIILFLFYTTHYLFADNGDLRIAAGGVALTVTMETVSLPFEGITYPNYFYLGRSDTSILNGCVHKRIDGNNIYNWQIFKHTFNMSSSQVVVLSSCMHEDPHANTPDGVWGFAKYKFVIIAQTNPVDTFIFYWNSLDTEYGKDNILSIQYYKDWRLTHNASIHGFILSGAGGTVSYDTIYTTERGKELTMWGLLLNRENPVSRKFFCRTTPLGVSPQFQFDNSARNFVIGTTIVLDTVYRNLGTYDRYGFNTIDTNGSGNLFYYYYSFPPIDTAIAQNDKGNTFCTPAWFCVPNTEAVFGIKITAEAGDTLILKRNKNLWISGNRIENKGDTLLFKSGSTLIKDVSAEIFQCFGGRLIFESGANTVWRIHSCQAAMSGGAIEYSSGNHTVKDSGFVAVGNGGTLRLGSNVTLTFDGGASPLILMPGSQVILGNNSKIEFKNGAHLRANGCSFSCPSGSWQGITLENSTYDTITNCTFSGSSAYLSWEQDSSSASYIKKITGNTFNSGVVSAINTNYFIFQNNTFNCASMGGSPSLLHIVHNTSSLPPRVALNIGSNTFIGGSVQLRLEGYAANSVPYYIYRNTFTGPSAIGLYAKNLTGEFKNNRFTDSSYTHSAAVLYSTLNFFGNKMKSINGHTVNVITGSTGNLAPVLNTSSQLVWYGGFNEVFQHNPNTGSSNRADSYFDESSVLLMDKGRNCLYYNNISPNYHIIGDYSVFAFNPVFNAGKTYWSPSTPKASFNVSVTFGTAGALTYCPAWQLAETIEIEGTELTDMGGGTTDTVLVTSDDDGGEGGSGGVSSENEDANLYWQVISNKRNKNYSTAIQKAKDLINDHDSSSFVIRAFDELYTSHHLSDTTGSQSNTNSLFSPLKSFLEAKMSYFEENPPVSEKIYHYYLMTLVKLKQYSNAISGYENIMENHPNPVVRLVASWDRSAVVLLMGGSGGSYNEWRTKKILNNDPHRTARKVYKQLERTERTSKQYTKEEKSAINERVTVFNPVNHKEFEEKVSADMVILFGLNHNNGNISNNGIPRSFKLYQNYPNPFNPITTIKYDIPKDGLIKIKIYDILGREVFSVNEFKNAGTYEVKFDGFGFASGVYFYKLESGSFIETKKMVLVK